MSAFDPRRRVRLGLITVGLFVLALAAARAALWFARVPIDLILAVAAATLLAAAATSAVRLWRVTPTGTDRTALVLGGTLLGAATCVAADATVASGELGAMLRVAAVTLLLGAVSAASLLGIATVRDRC